MGLFALLVLMLPISAKAIGGIRVIEVHGLHSWLSNKCGHGASSRIMSYSARYLMKESSGPRPTIAV